ncbi:MAG: DUF4167 domain-containing protein [Rhodobacteraceae bacterium]|nr:DUF4167 domain-containing protein [Paracoccaceae bacterium]
MRPGNQNNKRMRGRGRKGPNPLSRTYDSNGPDVKIRGTAQHVAEKYQQLARDAQASGDRIMSENYYQHAEHYLRIVAAAQPQTQPSTHSGRGDGDEMESDSENVNSGQSHERRSRSDRGERSHSSEPVVSEDSPQPFIENMPVIDDEGKLNGGDARSNGEDGEGDSKPRRRVRGTRGRGVRRNDGESNDSGAAVAADGEGEAASGEEAEAKPRRRVARPRRPKAEADASEAPAEVVPAGE